MLEAALAYHSAGLHPIPVEPRGKRPLVKWQEYQDRQPTEDELRSWWNQTPNANVGLAMGRGTFVVDVDGPEGHAALRANGIDLEYTDAPIVETGKGRHYYFSGEAPDRIGVLEKVDVRSHGGFVVAPPSVHASGVTYQWLHPITDAGLPTAPVTVRALLARPTKPSTPGPTPSTDNWLESALSGVSEGGRDNTCTRLAGYLLGRGLPVEAVTILLTSWGERCDPPFPADQVGKCVSSIAKRDIPDQPAPPAGIEVAVAEAMAEIAQSPAERKRTMRSTEFPRLDNLLGGGFEKDDYTIIGGRPGTGKTIFGLQVARKTAEDGRGVLYVSREMRASKLVRRLLVQVSGVRASDVKAGTLTDGQRGSLKFAARHLSELPFWITNVPTVAGLDETVAGFTPGELGLVVVDYLQLMRGPSDMRDKRATVEYVSKSLKDITTRHGIPVLCLSSLRRLGKRRDGEREAADMSDLRESGELEHDADNVVMLTREFDSDVCDAKLVKARDGRVGEVKMRFKGELLSLEELP